MNICKKCGNEFKPAYMGTTSSVYDELCGICVHKWFKFFDENSDILTVKYPKEFNPTWRIFIGKVKVQFT